MTKKNPIFLIILGFATLAVMLFILLQQSFTHQKVAGTNIFLQPSPVTILTTGDLMLGRSVNYLGHQKQDYAWSLREISPFLRRFDYSIANLENPIITHCPLTNDGMVFCADHQAGPALADFGPDLLTLANNHTLNYGQAGLQATQTILTQNLVSSVSSGEFFTKRLQNRLFGVLSFDDVSQSLNLTDFAQLIKQSREQVDILLVALHFGQEYRYQPDQRQQTLARLALDTGASVVLGNHSHWFGPVELYGDGAIIYSHGNFVFDQMWSEETRQGITAAWRFNSAGKLQQITLYPVYITHYGQANLAQNTPIGDQIITKMQAISHLGEITDGTLVINLPEKKGLFQSKIKTTPQN